MKHISSRKSPSSFVKKGLVCRLISCMLLFSFCTFQMHAEVKTHGNDRLKIYSSLTRDQILQRINKYSWAQKLVEDAHQKVDKYVDRHQTDPEWIISRMQMYWKNKYTNPVVIGAHYAYATGKAPVPTVRFTGGRDWATDYGQPKLEDVVPYMDYRDDEIYLQNIVKPGKPWEWVPSSQTAHQIEMINVDIMEMAQESAFLYWLTGEEKYGRFSKDILMKYVEGMYYREVPVTKEDHFNKYNVGLSSFEVIHEKVVTPMTLCYDFIYPYLQEQKVSFPMIHKVFQKFSDQIIENGKSHTNWNIFQAKYVTYLALALDEDAKYANGHGRHFYINTILNETSPRQKSLKEFCEVYDPITAMWNEASGYSQSVTKDMMDIIFMIDGLENKNILKDFSILERAAWARFEYRFPNKRNVAYGDGHSFQMAYEPFEKLLSFYRKYGNKEKETELTAVMKDEIQKGLYSRENANPFERLFNYVDELLPVEAKEIPLYSANFYTRNINLFILRNRMDQQTGLACGISGTGFNHENNNGINIELFGKGYPIGVDAGPGTSYWVPNHNDYFVQAASHNTVIIDGISRNGSNRLAIQQYSEVHRMLSCFPAFNKKDAQVERPVSYVDNQYLESSTNSMQRRLNSIIRTGNTSGYIVDIFRSHKLMGGDKMHDYLYHNLGQTLNLFDRSGKALNLSATSELSSKEGLAKGYDFFFHKNVVKYDGDFKGTFALDFETATPKQIYMDVWMKGEADRKLYSVKGHRAAKGLAGLYPKKIDTLAIPALIVRQHGEAWNRPFVAIFEPYSNTEGKTIESVSYMKSDVKDFVGIDVQSQGNRHELILNHTTIDDESVVADKDIRFKGIYGVVSMQNKQLNYILLGSGKQLVSGSYSIIADNNKASVLFESKGNNQYQISSDAAFMLQLPFSGQSKLRYQDASGNWQTVNGQVEKSGRSKVVRYQLPELDNCKVELF